MQGRCHLFKSGQGGLAGSGVLLREFSPWLPLRIQRLTCLSRGKVLRFESVSLSIGTMAEAGTENVRDLYRRVEQKMLVGNEV